MNAGYQRFSLHAQPGGDVITDGALVRVAFPAHSRILDCGCGAGDTCRRLNAQGHEAIGVDLRYPMASSQAGGRFVAGDVRHLPFADGAFSGVIAECLLSLLPDLDGFLNEARRVLTPGGKILLADLCARDGERFSVFGAQRGLIRPQSEIRAAMEARRFRLNDVADYTAELRAFVFQTLWNEGDLRSLGMEGAGRGMGNIGYFCVIGEKI